MHSIIACGGRSASLFCAAALLAFLVDLLVQVQRRNADLIQMKYVRGWGHGRD